MTINSTVLTKTAGIAAIIGGVLRIISSFVPFQPDVVWMEVVYFIVDYCLLIGLSGFYLILANQLGVLGLITYFVSSVGLSSIVGPDPVYLGVDLYQVGGGVILFGLTALGVQSLVRGLAHLQSGLWIASFIFSTCAVLMSQQSLISVTGILFGLGFVVSGLEMFAGSSKNGLPPV
jgi:hypothetical protein